MIRYLLLFFLFSFYAMADDKSVMCQPDSFGLRKNYEIWLLQRKIVIDDQLEEIPLAVLDLIYGMTQDLRPLKTKRIAPLDANQFTDTILLNQALYDEQYQHLFQYSLQQYCQGKADLRLSPLWYFPSNEISSLLKIFYSKEEVVQFIENQSNLQLNAPDSFSFKRFEAQFSEPELYKILYLILKYRDFHLWKIKALSRLQNGLELKDKNANQYIHSDKVLRFSDAFFHSSFPSQFFRELAVAYFYQMEQSALTKYQALSFDQNLKPLKQAQFLNDVAQNSVEADFVQHFEAFFTIPEALHKTAPVKFDFFKHNFLKIQQHPDLMLEKYQQELKNIKTKNELDFFELRSESKGEFDRIDFIFNHNLHDINNQLKDHLHIKIDCGKDLVIQAENKDFVMSANRARVSQIVENKKAIAWKQCNKFKVTITQSGRERFRYEFIKN